MTRNAYKNLLIESAVADIKKIEVFKSPADRIIGSIRTGNVPEEAGKTRCAVDAIAVLGRIYDAHDEDRPIICENDDEHEAQGDSEIAVDIPDQAKAAKIQDIADVIDDDAGSLANPGQQDQFDNSIVDDAVDTHLDESFVMEGLEEEDEIEEEDLPEDDDDEIEEEELPEDEDEGVSELPEDEIEDNEVEEEELPEDDDEEPAVVTDDETAEDLPEDELPEDEVEEDDTEELPEDEDGDGELPDDEVEEEDETVEEELPEDDKEEEDDIVEEDVDDSTLDETEQTGEGQVISDDNGETVAADPIPVDGEVYEDVEDPTMDANEDTPAAVPEEATGAEAAVADEGAAATDDTAVTDGATEDPTIDANEDPAEAGAVPEQEDKTDPVLDIDSQVVASDTTNESVMESFIRALTESADEGYMSYESEDIESED